MIDNEFLVLHIQRIQRKQSHGILLFFFIFFLFSRCIASVMSVMSHAETTVMRSAASYNYHHKNKHPNWKLF